MFALLNRSGKRSTIKFTEDEQLAIDATHAKAVANGYMKPNEPFYCIREKKEVLFYMAPFYMAGGLARCPETGDIQDPWSSLAR